MAPRRGAPYDTTMVDDDDTASNEAGRASRDSASDAKNHESARHDPAGDDDGLFPISRDRFMQAVIDRVRRRFPLVKIGRARQPFSVRVNGHVASLENLFRISRLKPGDLQHQIERWAVELLRATEGTPDREASLDEIGDRLMPMILPADGKSEDGDRIEPIDMTGPKKVGSASRTDSLITQPLVAGLRIGYVIDGDRTIAYVPWDALDRWKIDLHDLHERAMTNLAGRSETMNAHAAQDETGEINLILFQSLDGFDASRLLLPNLHDRLREHLGSPFVAAVPNRDILLCFRNDPDAVASLRGQIKHDYRNMPHQITERLLLVTPDGVAPYD